MALSEKMMPFLYINITNIKKIKKKFKKYFRFSKKFCIFAMLKVIKKIITTMNEKIIENGYTLVDMLNELAEELENFNADDELDRRFIFANKKLADALRHYIKVNYGDAILYSDEPSDDTITGD